MKKDINFKPEFLNVYPEGWSKANVNSLKLILEEARRYEQSIFDAGGRISARGFAFISILTPTAIILISIIARNVFSDSKLNVYSLLALFAALTIIYIITRLGQVIFPKFTMMPGHNPKNLILPSLFGIIPEYEHCADIATMLALIQAKQYSIDYNNNQNFKRHSILKHAILCMWWLLIISVIILFAIPIFS